MRILWATLIAATVIIMFIGCQKGSGPVAVGKFGYGTANITVNITQPQDQSVVRSNPVTVSGSVPSGIEVMVNGIPVNLESGHFSSVVQLETGPNMIEVLAKDSEGRETARYINIVYVP